MIAIFSITPQEPKRPSAFAVSLMLHCAVLLVVGLGLNYSQAGFSKAPVRKYPVQFIRVELFDPAVSNRLSQSSGDSGSEWRTVQAPPPRFQIAKQTVIRMDVPPNVLLKDKLPIPAALVWGAPLPVPARFISPPKENPSPRSFPSAPSFNVANREMNPAPMSISDASFTNTPKLPLPPSTSAPVQINIPPQGKQIPQTPSPDAEPTPTGNAISIPDIQLRAQSLVVFPPANQIALQHDGSSLQLPAREVQGSGEQGPAATDGKTPEVSQATGLTRITLPTDGKFSAVVLGSAASELYPESEGLLTGNIVYTVYLRVGLRKNWILQYSLPKGSEPDGTAVEAPWPFLIMRPDQLSTLDLDYVIVRGSINSNGRFQQLALVYPTELQEQEKLLGALRQWSFRPANRSGQPIAVDALLVIPMQPE